MTHGSYCSPLVNDLNDVCKKDQIDHNLQKLCHFEKMRTKENKVYEN